MSGNPDPLYVRARAALLDAVNALSAHLDSVVLVGAQAIYLHTGDADFGVAEFTTDADLAIQPAGLAESPLIHELLADNGFVAGDQPGAWTSASGIAIDLMVPAAVAGPGSRGADLGSHGRRAARSARGLEPALIDNEIMVIKSLDPTNRRTASMKVAGPAALLVAKTHKIAERIDQPGRTRDKDALDVLRLLQATDTQELAHQLTRLTKAELSSRVTTEAIDMIPDLFSRGEAKGVAMAVRAASIGSDPDIIAASLTTLTVDLIASLDR